MDDSGSASNPKDSQHYFLTTARLGFRSWSSDDLPAALALWGNSETTRLIGGPFSPAEIEQKLSREIASLRDHKVQYWPMFLVRTGEHVGCGGLRPYKLEDRIYELGFHLLPAYWGQGLAVEAGRGVIAYAFDSLGAKALFAGHHPANEASRKVILKLGFTFARNELYKPTGLIHPSYLLARPHPAAAE